jgi:hypothetical protein
MDNWTSRWLCSWMLHHVVSWKVLDISEVLTASIITVMSNYTRKIWRRSKSGPDMVETWPDQWMGGTRFTHCPDNRSSKHLWNISQCLPITWWYMSEDSHLFTHQYENFKCHPDPFPIPLALLALLYFTK